MAAREKKQCQIRFYADEFEKIQEKAKLDGLSYQQLGDVLFSAYLRDNKHVRKLVDKFVESKNKKDRKFRLDDIERNELLRLIEEEHSPLRY